jgi:hypothetical protein
MEVWTAMRHSIERHVVEVIQQQRNGLQELEDLRSEAENRIARIAATDATTVAEGQAILLRLKDKQQSFGNQARAMLSKLDLARRLPRLPTMAELWEQSGHTDAGALREMLAPFDTTLPPVLFNGLNEVLRRQRPSDRHHLLRYGLVFEGHYAKRLPWPAACKYASERLAGTSAAGGPDAMWKSYKRVNKRAKPSATEETVEGALRALAGAIEATACTDKTVEGLRALAEMAA